MSENTQPHLRKEVSDLTVVGGRVGTNCIHPATFTEHDQNDISSVAVEDASHISHPPDT